MHLNYKHFYTPLSLFAIVQDLEKKIISSNVPCDLVERGNTVVLGVWFFSSFIV